jgi:hypothetical protein
VRILILVLPLLLACSPWTKQDTLLEIGAIGATSLDWYQTEQITRDCAETNPVLGLCGQRVPVNVYMPASMVVHAAVAWLLPAPWRTIWQAAMLGAETSTVWENYWGSPSPSASPRPHPQAHP